MQVVSRIMLRLFVAGLICRSGAAITLQYGVEELDDSLFQISYYVTDFEFQTNQELEIRFDPTQFLELSGETAPPGFDVLLLQPGNPLGTNGLFSAVALIDRPDLTVGFSVVALMASNGVPTGQSFAINQLSDEGIVISELATGDSTPGGIPEPATLSLTAVGVLTGGLLIAVRSRRKNDHLDPR